MPSPSRIQFARVWARFRMAFSSRIRTELFSGLPKTFLNTKSTVCWHEKRLRRDLADRGAALGFDRRRPRPQRAGLTTGRLN